MYKRLGTIMLGAAAALSIAACSPPGENPSDQPPGAENRPTELAGVGDVANSSSKAPTSHAKPSRKPGECTADDITVEGSYGSKPTVTIPQDCDAPSTLLTKDLKVGNGPEATEGSTLRVRYQLVVWSSGEVVDGNFGGGQPLPVRNLGEAQLIEGWNKGLVGIKEGGRRLLVVPPQLAYGQQGKGQAVGPNETLVFVIDAVSVQPA